ncbi:MAG TPA: rod shape-determining protein MreD [Coleofasciculaceae cyanobacterium]|jgi:rod shape-determining protein MreD
MPRKNQTSIDILKVFNILFILASVVVCSILMLVNIPGMELLETNPNWLLIWVVAWSIKRTIWQGAIAGLMIGWIYDGITVSSPSHALSFVLVGVFTSSLQKQKYIGEDFISVAFVVFFMTIFAETIFAWQYAKYYLFSISENMQKYEETIVISAIITSLWSPAFYYPFNLWNEKVKLQTKVIKE